MNAKQIIVLTASLALVLAGCGKKTVPEKNSETISENIESTEEAQEPENSIEENKEENTLVKVVDSVLFEGTLDSKTWVKEQKEFSDFSTPLAIGDKIILQSKQKNQDAICIWKNTSCIEYDDNPHIKHNSVAYLLATADYERHFFEFCDDNGNTGWISSTNGYFLQKKYTAGDSIIKKLWGQAEYDFACFSPDGKTVAFHRFDYLHGSEKGVTILNRETGEEIYSANKVPRSRISYAFSPDGKYFYFVTGDDTLCELDTESGKFTSLQSVWKTSITGIYPLPDCENVLLALYSGWAMYNRKSEQLHIFPSDDFMWANSFAFSPNGKLIAGSATNPADICIWDMNGNLRWQKYGEYCGSLHFSKDSKTLFVVNGTGITALDAETGEEIFKKRISFPYQLRVADCEVNEKKDSLVFALNEYSEIDREDSYASYIYVYELSTGKFVQAERIVDENKKIETIALSPDGEYIAIRIKDGTHVNECHQVICKIDLDKEARSIPKIARSEAEEKAMNYLLDTEFDLGGWEMNFFCDGTYTMCSRHIGVMKGRYELYEDHGHYYARFSGCEGYGRGEEDFVFEHKDANGGTWRTSLPGTYRLDPDYIDFNVCGAFTYTDDAEVAIPSCNESPSRKEYDYYFTTTGGVEKVYKFPTNGEKGQSHLYVRENTKMRKEPFLSAEPVYMSHYDYDSGVYTESRCVVYAGDKPRIVGKTVREDTIDGVKAPWYLVWEFDGGDGPDASAELVWVFGGFSDVVDDDWEKK